MSLHTHTHNNTTTHTTTHNTHNNTHTQHTHTHTTHNKIINIINKKKHTFTYEVNSTTRLLHYSVQ